MKNKYKFGLLILFVIFSLLLGLRLGSVNIPFSQIIFILVGTPSSLDTILLSVRLPRVLSAFLVGMALAVSGTVMQSVLQNPLASSYTLGVSSGASLGVAIVIISGFSLPFFGLFTLPLFGFFFGFATVLLAMAISRQIDGGLQNQTIILIGMIVSLFANALLSILTFFFRNSMEQLVLWQTGSFSGKNWVHVKILFPLIILGILGIWHSHREMDLLTFGDQQAESMGVSSEKKKRVLLLLASLLTGAGVCFTGVIGFLDLIVPHLMRKLFGSSHKVLIPASALFGGGFMVLCDTLARFVFDPVELPVGAVLSLLGAPFFLWIYFRSRKKGEL